MIIADLTLVENLSIVAIAALVAGALAPVVVKWIVRHQKNWRFKLIKDNGRIDLIDEFDYWRKRLARERKSLEEASRQADATERGDDVNRVIARRLDMLNKFLASRITGDKALDAEAADQLEALVENRAEFMDSTRMAFTAAHPRLIHYLEKRGLTTREINYCCLYLIGLRAKEIGNYLGLRSHYNTSSSIRAKLGLESNATNLGIYLRKLMKGEIDLAEDSKDTPNKYTRRQLRAAFLTELLFDYLGLMILACAFLGEPIILEVCVIVATLSLLVMGIVAAVKYRSDVSAVAKLIASMNQLSALPLIGTIVILALFAEPFIPQAAYPYLGYPSLLLSQLLLIYGVTRPAFPLRAE